MKNKAAQTGGNIPLALFFAVFVIGIIISSFIWKGVMLFRKSVFDGQHQYIIFVKSEGNNEAIVFNPDVQNINQVLLTGKYSADTVEKDLEVPIDSTVTASTIKKPLTSFMFSLIFLKNSQLPIADRIKLWFFTRSLKDTDISSTQMQLPVADNEDKSIEKLFTDRTLYQEAKTITIINSTDVNGLGSRLAKLLTNIGANVIMVTSGNIVQKSSINYVGQEGYTISRISKVMDIQPQLIKSKSSISDITVIIGEDRANTNNF